MLNIDMGSSLFNCKLSMNKNSILGLVNIFRFVLSSLKSAFL